MATERKLSWNAVRFREAPFVVTAFGPALPWETFEAEAGTTILEDTFSL